MKKITTLILITLLTAAAFGQDITGPIKERKD